MASLKAPKLTIDYDPRILRAHLRALSATLASSLTPPPPLRVSEWADQHAIIPATISAEPGRWTSYPYQVAILDAFSDPHVEYVICMKSARIGWTRMLGHVIGYHIAHDPCSVLLVEPALEDAKGESREAIAPIIDGTPVLRRLVAPPKRNSPENTVFRKFYPGGILHIIGANSPRGFRRITVRVVLLDEVDAYPPVVGTEGDPIALAVKRSETFVRRKIAIGSTPTIAGASRIEDWWASSSRGYWLVPCPNCGTFAIRLFFPDDQPPTVRGRPLPAWRPVWDGDDPETARWRCDSCAHEHDPSDRSIDFHGQWLGEDWEWIPGAGFRFAPSFRRRIGFFVWAADALHPRADIRHIVSEYLAARESDERLVVFVNTVLGRPWQPPSTGADPDVLAARVEHFEHEVPRDDVVLTAGVDVQGDRLELEVVAWSATEESWSIAYEILPGDTSQDQVWDMLADYLKETWAGPSANHSIVAVAIDSGFRTDRVFEFCRRAPVICYPVKGVDGIGRPIVTPRTRRNAITRRRRGHATLEVIGVDAAKALILQRAMLQTPGPGYMHIPDDRDQEWFRQLNAERLVIRRRAGRNQHEWVKVHDRNEALDCRVYALAALRLFAPQTHEYSGKPRKLASARTPQPRQDQRAGQDFLAELRHTTWSFI